MPLFSFSPGPADLVLQFCTLKTPPWFSCFMRNFLCCTTYFVPVRKSNPDVASPYHRVSSSQSRIYFGGRVFRCHRQTKRADAQNHQTSGSFALAFLWWNYVSALFIQKPVVRCLTTPQADRVFTSGAAMSGLLTKFFTSTSVPAYTSDSIGKSFYFRIFSELLSYFSTKTGPKASDLFLCSL